jgi:hypothetical protein
MDVPPPPSLRLHQKDEGRSEIDIMIETELSVWFIEAKFKSDISTQTTSNATRDQIIRNFDVGSWYAGVRDFYFARRGAEEGLASSAHRATPAGRDEEHQGLWPSAVAGGRRRPQGGSARRAAGR